MQVFSIGKRLWKVKDMSEKLLHPAELISVGGGFWELQKKLSIPCLRRVESTEVTKYQELASSYV